MLWARSEIHKRADSLSASVITATVTDDTSILKVEWDKWDKYRSCSTLPSAVNK